MSRYMFELPNALKQNFFLLELKPVHIILIPFTLIIVYKLCNMDLMRFIQNLQDSKGSTHSTETKEKLKDLYRQKDQQIKVLEDRVKCLESEVEKLQVDGKDKFNSGVADILKKYEALIAQLMKSNNELKHEKRVNTVHVDDLEKTITELMQKYELAKNVIRGLESNEKELQTQLDKLSLPRIKSSISKRDSVGRIQSKGNLKYSKRYMN